MSIQDFVVPVVRFTSERPGAATLVDAVGTAFFVDDRGTFVTTGSALERTVPGASLGLAVRIRDGHAPAAIVPVLEREFAAPPWDVAVGRADVETRGRFTLDGVQAAPLLWEAIAAFGCIAVDRSAGDRPPVPVTSACAGSVLRELPGDGARVAPTLALSFAVPARLRGAPVFVPGRPRSRLVGICVGNHSLGELEYPAWPAGASEVRVETHGVAQDLRYLAHWRPAFLRGATLRDVCSA